MAEAAPARFMRSSGWVTITVCGEPVSKRATQPSCTATGPLWILILGVNEESTISKKPRPLFGEQGRVLTRVGGAHNSKDVARGPIARLVESRCVPIERWLLTGYLDTVAVA